jgi:hypothetical protein
MSSLRIWKLLQNENRVDGDNTVAATSTHFVWNDLEYTIRGLENYIHSSSRIIQRQRDLYTVVVLQDPYDTDRIHNQVQVWSDAALQRAQSYAIQDAIDVNADRIISSTTPPPRYYGSSSSSLSSRHADTTPPRSPTSLLPVEPSTPVGTVYATKHKLPFMNVQEMNKLLIAQHLKSPPEIVRKRGPWSRGAQAPDPTNKKPKRRSSTMSAAGTTELESPQEPSPPYRRYSTSHLLSPPPNGAIVSAQRRPVSLQFHTPSTSRHLLPAPPRRHSMMDDYQRHMNFCNQLLNDLPPVTVTSNNIRNQQGAQHATTIPDPHGASSMNTRPWHIGMKDGNCNSMAGGGIEDESIRRQQPQLRRDSFYFNRNHDIRSTDVWLTNWTSAAGAAATTDRVVPMNATTATDMLYQQMLIQQQQQQQYATSVSTFSPLRRDSLAGHFGAWGGY